MKAGGIIKSNKFIVEGNVFKAIVHLSIPLMVNNLIQTIYNLIDGIWLGRLGATEFASTVFVFHVIFLFIMVGSGIAAAGTSLLSQLLGADKKRETTSYVYQLLAISAILALSVTILGYFSSPLIVKIMGAKNELYEFSSVYLSITFLGYPAVVLPYAMSAIMQSQGDTRSFTLASGIAAIVNIFLDPLFIFETIPGTSIKGFNMGVAGAALATIISQYIMLIIGIFIIRNSDSEIKVKIRGQKIQIPKIKKIINIAIPSIVGQTSSSVGFIFLNIFITAYGTTTLAAYGIVNRITSLLMQPTMGIGAAIPAIIGQNMGAKRYDRVRECFKKSHILSFTISVIGAFFMFFGAKHLVSIFVKPDEVMAVMPIAMDYIIYSLFIMPMMGAFSVFQGFFQGTGHTEYGMRMSMYRLWLVRLPLIFAFGKLTNLGSTGIWISMLLSNLFVNLYAYYHYKKDKWCTSII
ncbi:MAG: MATE family efflux transporter [Tissierellia bacterium]|nr:MATE family efflux transporter [Tissierellia bacterium]